MVEEKRKEKKWANNKKEKNIYKHSIIDHAQFVLIKLILINQQVHFVVVLPNHYYHSFLYLHEVLIDLIVHVLIHIQMSMNDNVLVQFDMNLQ